jgi:hypothetical protein
MDEIYATLTALLPPKRKQTPSGWISFNAVCCHHRGESRDDRQRGGIMPNPKGGFSYHCFNCNFKAGWTTGHLLSNNTKNLFKWLGLSVTDISKLGLVALRLKEDQTGTIKKSLNFELQDKPLPEDCKHIMKWAEEGCSDPELIAVLDYILDRGMSPDWYDWMWSPTGGYKDRVIIPFYFEGRTVGYTGRKIKEGKPKYLTDAQPGYVFNLDSQGYDRQYVIVVEGQFDAIAVDGVAVMHNDPNETQCARINALGKEVIVVPDKDRPGAKLIKAAIDNKWAVSMPPWEEDIKDVADAVKKYGRLYTLLTILQYREANEIKIQLLKKKLESLHE